MLKALMREGSLVVGFYDTGFVYRFSTLEYRPMLLELRNEYRKRHLPITKNMASFYKLTFWNDAYIVSAIKYYESNKSMVAHLTCMRRILNKSK